MKHVIVIGAGLAGLSCAFELVEKGVTVTVLEARGVVGGRTSSWFEEGMHVESGLHRFLGTYDYLIDLIKRAGLSLDDILYWEDAFEIKVANGPSAVFGLAPLYKPFKTLGGFIGNTHFFSLKDKIKLLKFFIYGLTLCRKDPLKLDQFSVLEVAQKYKLSPEIIHRFLVPLTAGLFFIPPDRYSAYVFFQVFVIAFKKFYKLRFGAFKGGMSEVLAAPLAKAIEQRGGTIRSHSMVQNLLIKDKQVTGVEVNQEQIKADHVVVATSLAQAQKLLGPSFSSEAKLASFFALPSMPAVTLQIELDQPLMPIDRTTFVPGTCIEAYSEQSRTTFPESKGRLSLIIGPPEKFLALSAEEILKRVIEDFRKIHIDLASHVVTYRKVAWPSDFYLLSPGHEHLRPSQNISIPGLTLAGDYTKQPFLASMEGSTFSGKKAAEYVMQAL